MASASNHKGKVQNVKLNSVLHVFNGEGQTLLGNTADPTLQNMKFVRALLACLLIDIGTFLGARPK